MTEVKKRSRFGYYAACTLLGFVLGCGCKEPNTPKDSRDEKPSISKTKKKSLFDIVKTYSEPKPIVYSDFSEIDFDSIPIEKIKLPSDLGGLERYLLHGKGYGSFRPKISNAETLEKLIFAEASKLDYDIKRISALSAKDAIMLSVEIVASRMKYHLVDSDHDFIAKHGSHLPIDEYFELGLGDCDKYSGALMAVFELIKKNNSNLENVYITRDLGGLAMAHSWNNITLLTKDKVILTHIDPTFYDNGVELEAERGTHIPENDRELLAKFYGDVFNFKKSYDIYSHLLDETEKTKEKARILKNMAYTANQLRDKQKMDKVREQYLGLGIQEHLDNILYYSYRVEEKVGNYDRAEQFKQELIDKFPDSFWVDLL